MSAHVETRPEGQETVESPETVLAVVTAHGDQEVLLVEREGQRLCRVRGTTREERTRLRELAELLVSLEADGVRAVPRLRGEDSTGLLLEAHAPLRPGGGRRRARPEDATPPTLERRGLLEAREDLEQLVEALHARGRVVGLEPGAGLGARPDGAVVLADLRGLRSEGSVGARMQDQHWLDSVLEDQGRTLRRRVDILPGRALPADRAARPRRVPPSSSPRPVPALLPDAAAVRAAEPSPASSAPPSPAPPAWVEGWRARLARGASPTEPLDACRGTARDHRVTADGATSSDLGIASDGAVPPGDEAPCDAGILGPEDTDRHHRRAGARASRARRRGRAARTIGPRRRGRGSMPRRSIVLVAAAGVLVLGGGATALAAALVQHGEAPHGAAVASSPPGTPEAASAPSASTPSGSAPSASGTASATAPATGSATAPPAASATGSADASAGIDDPQALVQELALGRHRFVTGRAETSMSAEGSPAAAQDEALREAYRDVTVEGEGPVVTSARIVRLDEQSGTAQLRATLDQGELRITARDGAVVVRPAAGAQEVVLDLVREDGHWRVQAARAVEA